MPCTTIHLAIAKEYCKLHPEENYKDFCLGSNLPDTTTKKIRTHYGTCIKDAKRYVDYARNKVDLNTAIKFVDLNNAINIGIFMHLICDYAFYNDLNLRKDKKLVYSILPKDASKLSTEDYNVLTNKIVEKYGIDLNEMPPNLMVYIIPPIRDELIFFDEEEIYKFIERMSKIKLEKVYKDIQNGKIDFYPINQIWNAKINFAFFILIVYGN